MKCLSNSHDKCLTNMHDLKTSNFGGNAAVWRYCCCLKIYKALSFAFSIISSDNMGTTNNDLFISLILEYDCKNKGSVLHLPTT